MFVEKTAEEIDKMTTQEVIEYKAAKHAHDSDVQKAEFAKMIEDAIETKAPAEGLAELKAYVEKQTAELDRVMLAWKQMMEKPSLVENAKSEFIAFIERKSTEVKEKGATGVEKTEINAKHLLDVTMKAPALMTTANVVPNVTNGFNQLFGNYIDTEIHHVPKPDNFILDLVDVTTQPGTESIWYVQRVNEEGDAAFIAEGALKPLADAEYVESKAPIKEVAVRWKMTNRVMYHAPAVVRDFREHANELVEQKIDQQVLIGDGTGNNLSGIAGLASPFVVPTALALYYEEANIWDVVNATAAYVRLNNFSGPLTVVLNTVWMAQMAGIKDADGRYLVPPFVTPDGKRIGDVRVVFSNKMPADKILLGELSRFKVVFAERVIFQEGWENDDFSKNLTSFKLEAFVGTYLPSNYEGAIIYDDIATIQTAIAAP